MSDNVEGIGLSWLWMLSSTHPFTGCAVAHDRWYDTIDPFQSTIQGDRKFRDCCRACYNILEKMSPFDLWCVLNTGDQIRASAEFVNLSLLRQALWKKRSLAVLRFQIALFYRLCRARGLVWERFGR